jgi:cation:H+ antiporter
LVAGFIYLLMGGDLLVRGAVGLARRLHIPQVVVAATVVGFGTSLPELVVSVQATFEGVPGLILGNVVGSNIANVLLVGGASALVFPLLHQDRAVRRNVVLMIMATLGFAAFAVMGEIDRLMGVVLLGTFALILATTARSTLRAKKDADTSTPLDWVLGLPSRPGTITMFIVTGVVMLPLGAKLLVDSAIEIAETLQVPEPVVGLTVLAIGTSLPELTTTILAALERRSDIAIGAIVGSNTFNLLTIMGVTAILSPDPILVSDRFISLDVPVMIVSTVALAIFAWKGRPVGRVAGGAMLLAYILYLSGLYALV